MVVFTVKAHIIYVTFFCGVYLAEAYYDADQRYGYLTETDCDDDQTNGYFTETDCDADQRYRTLFDRSIL